MQWSTTRLRWLVLGSAMLLAIAVAGFFGVARYRAGKIWQRILARNGVNLRRETNGITWSQSSKGHTVFTLHASKATPEGKGKWALQEAVLVLYGRERGRDDRIYGKQFEYDESEGVLRALGEVHMDLQAPEPGGKAPVAGSKPDLGFTMEDTAANDPAVIHVRTSGLVYLRKQGIAATGEATEFRFRGITCESKGAEFDSAHSLVRLLADVRMSGQRRNASFTLVASHAELDRTSESANLTSPVLSSGERGARSDHAVFQLHKDGSLETAEADGAVQLRSATQTISAPRLDAAFGGDDQPKHARLYTGVSFVDSSTSAPAHGDAQSLDLDWDQSGQLSTATADGGVSYQGTGRAANGAREERELHGARMEASFAAGKGKKPELHRVHLFGGGQLRSSTAATGAAGSGSAPGTTVAADDLLATLAPANSRTFDVRSLDGTGHTRLEQTAGDGARQRSTGDTLQVAFAPPIAGAGASRVASATQSGHVHVTSWGAPRQGSSAPDPTEGLGDKAVYTGAEGTLTLAGLGDERASLAQGGNQLLARTITLHQGTGDAEAQDDVEATSPGHAGGAATHVLAGRARLLHAAQLTEFFEGGSRPVQLWQAGSQIQAAQVTLDSRTNALAARPDGPTGRVHAVFATPAANGRDTGKEQATHRSSAEGGTMALGRPGGVGVTAASLPEVGRDAVQVSASRMDFDDLHHEALFTGDVHMGGVMGEVTADRGAAFLKDAGGKAAKPQGAGEVPASPAMVGAAPSLSGALDHMVLLGNVKVTQPGRTGTGEELLYTASTGSLALTGTAERPPRVTGEQGSVVTGTTLIFQSADSTIIVAGTKGDHRSGKPTRVHTETDLKQ